MSLGSGADYEQVLHLRQIVIESSITPKIRLELQIDATPVNIRNGDHACWKASRTVEVTSTSDIALTVMTGHRPFRKEEVIRVTGSDVWNSLSGSKFLISRSITLIKHSVKASFEFYIPTTPGSDAAFAALQKVWDDAKGYRSLIGSSKLQQSFDTALKIGVALSEMDPFTKAAFALARTTFELLKEQQRYDDLILKLADSFKRILPFATIVALDSEMSTTLQVIVEDLFDIVEKGAQFICQYVQRTSINRLLVSLFSSEDREFIDRLQERLAKITDDFDRATAVDTLQAVHDARDRSLLQQVLKPIDKATYNLDRGCFEGTRQDILPKIFNWTSDSSSPTKILWLYGIPGSGKTSVATSLCDMLHTNKGLAASFFCRRDDPILSKPESLFPTLIYHLSSAWKPYQKLVANALRADSMLQPTLTKRLFDELIAKPLETLDQHPTRTLVIVIDALDECGDIESRRGLLSNILAATSAVGWLKVVVTSRHDHDIEAAFAKLGSDSYFSLDLDAAHDTQTDIRLFAKKKLASLGERRHIPNWPSEELLDGIAHAVGAASRNDQDDAMARGMLKFVAAFAAVISQSAPHIYLSALPFTPQNSPVSRCYTKLYPGTLRVRAGGHSDWPPVQLVLFGHAGFATSVAFSHDGTRVVSASWDNTVRVWDAESGKAVGEPFEGHTDSVVSVAFSHDGKHIVSGSWDETLRIWDAESGKAVGEPFEGHTSRVTSVAFSPDGKHIASGSLDHTLRVWDVETGKAVGEPFEGHTEWVTSVAFSPDGKYIVSGSNDRTIRVWDAESGKAVGEPFEGHAFSIMSVASSHDGKRIVSGSWDQTVCVWDAESGKAVGEPFEGHTERVTSVAFSPDGKYIVSGSPDKTIRVWNAEEGGPINFPHSVYYSAVVDGWVVDSNSQLLFWAPPALCSGLLLPCVKLIIGNFTKTTLDLTSFTYGESWTLCRDINNIEQLSPLEAAGSK